MTDRATATGHFLFGESCDVDRRHMLEVALVAALALAAPGTACALSIADLSEKEADLGLKAALERGATTAIAILGKKDGFLGNDRLRIPLPDWIQRFERAIKVLGRSKDIEAMKIGVNRAAEQAVPQAKALLAAAIRAMSVQDARAILTGGDNSVTLFFQDKTQVAMAQKFLPVVSGVTSRIGLAQQYNSLAEQVQQTGLVKLPADQQRVENHVTRKALEGLYYMIGEEERKIRANPLESGSEVLKKVFGALK